MSLPKSKNEHPGKIIDSKNGFDILECVSCGFKHIMPIPTADELENVYRHEYYSKDKPMFLQQSNEDVAWWNLVYSDRFDTFEEHLSDSKRRILDVGSGPGFFLKHGKDRGWITQGIEPSKQATKHARSLGLSIVEDFLSESSVAQFEPFDVVHASEVLEHISDPTLLLTLIHGLLKPGGIICLSVPNDYNPFQQTVRDVDNYDPWWLAPPHHINYFNFKSLNRLLSNLGFDVFLQEATFPIDMFLLMGDKYVGDDALGRQCHKKRMRMEMQLAESGNNELRRAWYRSMADLGIGREVCLFAKKC